MIHGVTKKIGNEYNNGREMKRNVHKFNILTMILSPWIFPLFVFTHFGNSGKKKLKLAK